MDVVITDLDPKVKITTWYYGNEQRSPCTYSSMRSATNPPKTFRVALVYSSRLRTHVTGVSRTRCTYSCFLVPAPSPCSVLAQSKATARFTTWVSQLIFHTHIHASSPSLRHDAGTKADGVLTVEIPSSRPWKAPYCVRNRRHGRRRFKASSGKVRGGAADG